MQKRKKKPSQHSQLKLAEAHRRNEFFYKFNYLVTAVTGDASVYRLLPPKELEKIFTMRQRALRIKEAPDSAIHPVLLEEIKSGIVMMLKGGTVLYTENGPEISLDMFFTTGMTLFAYFSLLKDEDFAAAKAFKKALDIISFHLDKKTNIIRTLAAESDLMGGVFPVMLNDFQKTIYWLEGENVAEYNGPPKVYYQFLVHTYQAECRHFVVDNISRPAYGVWWGKPREGLIHLSLEPSKLGLPQDGNPESFPVYIQTHALIRLKERIDCTEHFSFPLNVYASVSECNYYKKQNGSYLIAYTMDNKKVGYLLARIQEGVLLIQTFLFITHSGTPEGNKLLALTGLGKLDKAYLNIDKLSAFYASDIADNPVIKKIFVEAGCGDLFEIQPYIYSETEKGPVIPLADKIRMYLGIENREENTEIYVKEQMGGRG